LFCFIFTTLVSLGIWHISNAQANTAVPLQRGALINIPSRRLFSMGCDNLLKIVSRDADLGQYLHLCLTRLGLPSLSTMRSSITSRVLITNLQIQSYFPCIYWESMNLTRFLCTSILLMLSFTFLSFLFYSYFNLLFFSFLFSFNFFSFPFFLFFSSFCRPIIGCCCHYLSVTFSDK
jgi:hypothetical protein